jgi:xanthosine utilization system XapX-like protein
MQKRKLMARYDNHGISRKSTSGLMSIFLFGFGCYLLIGAYFALVDLAWPPFMPPQLDIFGLFFKIFGEDNGARIGALFLALLGAFFTVGTCIAYARNKRKLKEISAD